MLHEEIIRTQRKKGNTQQDKHENPRIWVIFTYIGRQKNDQQILRKLR